MKNVWDIFKVCNEIVTNLDIVKRITMEMIEDYSKNSTYYLEIWSSLKAYEGKSKKDYIDTIIEAIKESELLFPHLTVWYIISVNREKGLSFCLEEFDLAKHFIVEEKNKYVVGLDFSGNPSHADFEEYKNHIF